MLFFPSTYIEKVFIPVACDPCRCPNPIANRRFSAEEEKKNDLVRFRDSSRCVLIFPSNLFKSA